MAQRCWNIFIYQNTIRYKIRSYYCQCVVAFFQIFFRKPSYNGSVLEHKSKGRMILLTQLTVLSEHDGLCDNSLYQYNGKTTEMYSIGMYL